MGWSSSTFILSPYDPFPRPGVVANWNESNKRQGLAQAGCGNSVELFTRLGEICLSRLVEQFLFSSLGRRLRGSNGIPSSVRQPVCINAPISSDNLMSNYELGVAARDATSAASALPKFNQSSGAI